MTFLTRKVPISVVPGANAGKLPLAKHLRRFGLEKYAREINTVAVDTEDVVRLTEAEVESVAKLLPTLAKGRAWRELVTDVSTKYDEASASCKVSIAGSESLKSFVSVTPRTKAEEADFPSYIARALLITPVVELFGFIKDHRFQFKDHWITSRISDSAQLRHELINLYEAELMLSSLVLGVNACAYFEGVSEEMQSVFAEHDYSKLEFWVVLIGTIANLSSMQASFYVYVAMMVILPISSSNFWAFSRIPAVQWLLWLPSACSQLMVYASAGFLSMLLIHLGGQGPLVTAIVLAYCATFAISTPLMGYVFNLAIKSGAYGDAELCPNANQLQPQKVEEAFFSRVRENEERGITDADLLYGVSVKEIAAKPVRRVSSFHMFQHLVRTPRRLAPVEERSKALHAKRMQSVCDAADGRSQGLKSPRVPDSPRSLRSVGRWAGGFNSADT